MSRYSKYLKAEEADSENLMRKVMVKKLVFSIFIFEKTFSRSILPFRTDSFSLNHLHLYQNARGALLQPCPFPFRISDQRWQIDISQKNIERFQITRQFYWFIKFCLHPGFESWTFDIKMKGKAMTVISS